MGTASLLKNIDLDNLSKDSNEEVPFTKYYHSNHFKPRINIKNSAGNGGGGNVEGQKFFILQDT